MRALSSSRSRPLKSADRQTSRYGQIETPQEILIFDVFTTIAIHIFRSRKVLEITNGIDEPGSLNVHLTVSLLIAWVLVYFCIWRGIRTTGKIVYVTATLPYVILLILFIKGLTLPGSRDGILYYITPQWDRLTDPAVSRKLGCY